MAEMATYVGVAKRTATADPSTTPNGIARGLRCSLNASGNIIVTAGQAAVGDFISLAAIEAGKPGTVASMHGGGKVPAQGAVVTAQGDVAYTAVNGQFTNVSTGATQVGTWAQPCAGAGLFGEIELGV